MAYSSNYTLNDNSPYSDPDETKGKITNKV